MLATLPEQAEVLFDLVSQSTVRNKQSPEESAEHYGLDNGGAATAVALLDAPGADGQILTHIRYGVCFLKADEPSASGKQNCTWHGSWARTQVPGRPD
ncbi:TPA: hypothetical protein ACH3X1_011389 [Trebouxia sp. C0004]